MLRSKLKFWPRGPRALDGDRAKQRHRARQARHRQRQRAGLRIYRLELADRAMEDVISAVD